MFHKLSEFPFFNYFDLSLVESFSYKYLENRSCFKFKVENRLCINIVLFINTIKVWNEDSIRSHINVEIRLNIELVHLA